jgi:hypothetical protein
LQAAERVLFWEGRKEAPGGQGCENHVDILFLYDDGLQVACGLFQCPGDRKLSFGRQFKVISCRFTTVKTFHFLRCHGEEGSSCHHIFGDVYCFSHGNNTGVFYGGGGSLPLRPHTVAGYPLYGGQPPVTPPPPPLAIYYRVSRSATGAPDSGKPLSRLVRTFAKQFLVEFCLVIFLCLKEYISCADRKSADG